MAVTVSFLVVLTQVILMCAMGRGACILSETLSEAGVGEREEGEKGERKTGGEGGKTMTRDRDYNHGVGGENGDKRRRKQWGGDGDKEEETGQWEEKETRGRDENGRRRRQ